MGDGLPGHLPLFFLVHGGGWMTGNTRRNWDSHEDVKRDHEPLAIGMARAAAALIQDLKLRGMLEDTIILWTTKFGRMPCSQASKGRDHNPFVFTNWLCLSAWRKASVAPQGEGEGFPSGMATYASPS
jgi:hypothetical protein